MSQMINVSVTNLIAEMQFTGNTPVPFAVLYPTDYDMPLQSLSAGPRFPEEAREYLIKAFKADQEGFFGDNAQCRIPADALNMFLGWLTAQYGDPTIAKIDLDPHPDLGAHLTRPYWGNITPPLDIFEFDTSITLDLLHFARQPPSIEESLGMAKSDTVNLFIVWRMWVREKSVFEKLKQCPAIFLLDESAVESTQGGRCLGWYDGQQLSRDVGVENYRPCLK